MGAIQTYAMSDQIFDLPIHGAGNAGKPSPDKSVVRENHLAVMLHGLLIRSETRIDGQSDA
jgi:hypothetical protein